MITPDDPPPATSPPRTPEQYGNDAQELIEIVTDMAKLAPSKLYPLLVVARSMWNAKETA